MKLKVFVIILVLFILLPLGIMTDYSAWGEWETEFFQKVLGFVPEGIKNAIHIEAPFPDYTLKGFNPIVSYYISGLIGVVLIFGFFYLLKLWISNER